MEKKSNLIFFEREIVEDDWQNVIKGHSGLIGHDQSVIKADIYYWTLEAGRTLKFTTSLLSFKWMILVVMKYFGLGIVKC